MKRIQLALLLSILSLNLFSQFHWIKHPDNPIMTGALGEWDEKFIAPGTVLFYDDTYHMWYEGGVLDLPEGIGYATSPDGLTWTRYANNPIMVPGTEGEWDETGIQDCHVVKLDTIFHMWYTGEAEDNSRYRIGHATSPDGIIWTKDPDNPIMVFIEGNPANTFAFESPVIYDGSLFHLYYSTGIWNASRMAVNHAMSEDGYNWTLDPDNPIMQASDNDDYRSPEAVVYNGDQYIMSYLSGNNMEWVFNISISDDLSSWEDYDNNPVFTPSPTGSWDEIIGRAAIVYDSTEKRYKMWYLGGTREEVAIGYAEYDTRVPWLSVVSNKPVFDSRDTVVVEIDLDGIIYTVPEGTSPVIDSIIKYFITSVDALANTETQIPLTDLSIGQYTVVAVSNLGFVNTNPVLLRVVDDATPPVVILEGDSVIQGNTIIATSTKEGMLYLVIVGTSADLSRIRNQPFFRDSLAAMANIQVEFTTSDLDAGKYWLYAVDIYGIISEPDTISVLPVVGVEEITNAGISIYPNPANDLIIIETNKVGQYSIDINSMSGQLLHHTTMEGTSHQIDLSSFQKGVYFFTIRSKDFVTTRKIIKL